MSNKKEYNNLNYGGGFTEEDIKRNSIKKQETLEEVRNVERTELFNSIFSVVKKIPRKDVDGDAMDAPSCAYEIEQLFYNFQQEQDKNKFTEKEVDPEFVDIVNDNFWGLIDDSSEERLKEASKKWSLNSAKEFALSYFKKSDEVSSKGMFTYELLLRILEAGIECGYKFGIKRQDERMFTYDELRRIAYNAYCLGQLEEPTENKYNLWIQQFKKK
jgi:hypothetical protein